MEIVYIRKFSKEQVFFQKTVEKSKTPGLAADGTFPDPGKPDIFIIKCLSNSAITPLALLVRKLEMAL